MDNDDVVDTLNKLIETCKDGEYGFRTCAERVKSEQIRTLFNARAEDCAKGASELQACVVQLGGKIETDGSATGSMHRGWVKMKSAMGADSDLSMLEECERGEDAALERYRDALKEPLPESVAEIVRRQYEGVKRNHDQVRTLRDSVKASTS